MIKDEIICKVTRCEECPFWTEEGDWENCSRGGDPGSRYPQGDKWEEMLVKENIPKVCPLREEVITVKLAEDGTV